jgi:hypothetical protein
VEKVKNGLEQEASAFKYLEKRDLRSVASADGRKSTRTNTVTEKKEILARFLPKYYQKAHGQNPPTRPDHGFHPLAFAQFFTPKSLPVASCSPR